MTRYAETKVCAVMVTYNGGGITPAVAALLPQVDHLILVDNGSDPASRAVLETLAARPSVTLLSLGENLGQAAALNRGWREARRLGFPLVLTMDQDSRLAEGCVSALLSALAAGADSAGPCYTGIRQRRAIQRVRYLITSGQLLKTADLERVGGYTEALFIDSVDFDLSLRLREAGCRLVRVRDAGMTHAIGEAERDARGHTVYSHTVQRHYTMARNHYYILRRFFRTDPVFCLKKHLAYLKSLLDTAREPDARAKFAARRQGRKAAGTIIKGSIEREP